MIPICKFSLSFLSHRHVEESRVLSIFNECKCSAAQAIIYFYQLILAERIKFLYALARLSFLPTHILDLHVSVHVWILVLETSDTVVHGHIVGCLS